MVTESLMKRLKQVNISKDAEKTKQRASEAWKTASKTEQKSIMELTDLSRASIQRSYKTGHISAKIVIAMAQTFNLDPLYFTGVSDEKTACSDEQIRVFLIDLGYKNLVPSQPTKTRRRRARVAKETTAGTVDFAAAADAAPNAVFDKGQDIPHSDEALVVSDECQAFVESMTEDDLILLVKTVLLRAKAGGAHAEKAKQLKLFLLD